MDDEKAANAFITEYLALVQKHNVALVHVAEDGTAVIPDGTVALSGNGINRYIDRIREFYDTPVIPRPKAS